MLSHCYGRSSIIAVTSLNKPVIHCWFVLLAQRVRRARELCSAGTVLRTQPDQLFIKPQRLLCDNHKPSRSDTSVHIFEIVLARYGRKCLFCRSSAPWGCGATTPPWPNGFGLRFVIASVDHSRLPLWRCLVFLFREGGL